MKVKRGVVVDLLTALGVENATKMSDDEIMEKVNDFPRMIDEEEFSISVGQGRIMSRLAEAVDEEVEIHLVSTTSKKPTRNKAAEKPDNKPPKTTTKKTATKKVSK